MSEEKKEVITVRDFKSMIEGMDMIMGDDWTPNEDQWRRIRKKIDALIETETQPKPLAAGGQPVVGGSVLSKFPTSVPASIPSNAELATPPSSLTPPVAQPVIPKSVASGPVADGTVARVKTPDIDTSSGYQTGYV